MNIFESIVNIASNANNWLYGARHPQQPQAMTDMLNEPKSFASFAKAGQTKNWLSAMERDSKAGYASYVRAVGENIGIHTVRFSYKTGKPMHAWLDTKPKNGVEDIRVCIGPSGHGSIGDEVHEFAKNNVYTFKVSYPDGTSESVDFDTRGVKDSDKVYDSGQYATLSPAIPVRVGDYPNSEITIEAWPQGSAGVWGYIEGRRIILHT